MHTTEQPDDDVRFDSNRRIIGCTCPINTGKAPAPNCPISFPHAEVAWGKRRKHNDDSPWGAQIRVQVASGHTACPKCSKVIRSMTALCTDIECPYKAHDLQHNQQLSEKT